MCQLNTVCKKIVSNRLKLNGQYKIGKFLLERLYKNNLTFTDHTNQKNQVITF